MCRTKASRCIGTRWKSRAESGVSSKTEERRNLDGQINAAGGRRVTPIFGDPG